MKQLTIVGYLGKDAEILKKDDKISVLFSVAVMEKYEKDGQEHENTDWFSCFKNFKKEPESLMPYLKKGIKVFIQGKPNFGISNSGNGIYINNTINVQKFDILTFPETSQN